jgi:hypothetical protein
VKVDREHLTDLIEIITTLTFSYIFRNNGNGQIAIDKVYPEHMNHETSTILLLQNLVVLRPDNIASIQSLFLQDDEVAKRTLQTFDEIRPGVPHLTLLQSELLL